MTTTAKQLGDSRVEEIINIFHQLREKRASRIRYDEFVLKVLQRHTSTISDTQILTIVGSDRLTDKYVLNAVVSSGALSGEATLDLLCKHRYDVHMCEASLDAHPEKSFFLHLLQKLQGEKARCFKAVCLYISRNHKDVLTTEEVQGFEIAAGSNFRNTTSVTNQALNFLAA